AARGARTAAVRPGAGGGAPVAARPVAVRAGQGAPAPSADGPRPQPPPGRPAAVLLVCGAGLRSGGDGGQQRPLAGAGGGRRAAGRRGAGHCGTPAAIGPSRLVKPWESGARRPDARSGAGVKTLVFAVIGSPQRRANKHGALVVPAKVRATRRADGDLVALDPKGVAR